jgi:hypothetical protein
VTYREQGTDTEDFLNSDDYGQCVAKVAHKQIQTSVLKKIDACTEPIIITPETAMKTDPAKCEAIDPVKCEADTQTDSR